MNDSPPGAVPPKRSTQVLTWVAGSLATVGVITGLLYWNHELKTEREVAYYQKLKEQVHYQAKLFPAKVTFQRGATYQIEHVGTKPFRGQTGEFATCPDDSEGAELVEFYQAPISTVASDAWFADGSHPVIRSQLQSLFEVPEPNTLFRTLIVLKNEVADAWKLRVSLIPSPHGGLITPEGLSESALAALKARTPGNAPEKGEVDSRLSTGSPGIGGTRVNQREQAERKLEARHQADLRTYDDKHHHYYLVEAVREYDNGRTVVLRRYGKIYGPQTAARAEEIIRKMAATVTME